MVIYEEYRQHAMVFTARCFVVFALADLFPDALHLSPRAYSIWAESIEPSVRRLMGEAD